MEQLSRQLQTERNNLLQELKKYKPAAEEPEPVIAVQEKASEAVDQEKASEAADQAPETIGQLNGESAAN